MTSAFPLLLRISSSISPQKRIVTGWDSPIRMFYVAVVGKKWNNDSIGRCSGTLVSNNCVVTAAHCAKNKSKVAVYMGDFSGNVTQIDVDIPGYIEPGKPDP